MRSIWLTGSRPVRSEAATTMSGSDPSQREIMPLMTTESSTTITRSGSCCTRLGGAGLVNATLITHQPNSTQRAKSTLLFSGITGVREPPGSHEKSDQTDFLELGRDDVLV